MRMTDHPSDEKCYATQRPMKPATPVMNTVLSMPLFHLYERQRGEDLPFLFLRKVEQLAFFIAGFTELTGNKTFRHGDFSNAFRLDVFSYEKRIVPPLVAPYD